MVKFKYIKIQLTFKFKLHS